MGSQAEQDRSGDDCDLLDGGSIYGQMPSYLCERFPTEVRATASGFIYHQAAAW
jgi:hypothetical protein